MALTRVPATMTSVAPTTVTKDASNVFNIDFADNLNFILEASGSYSIAVTVGADQIGQAGNIIIKNTAATVPAALPAIMKTPNGDLVVWQTDSGDLAIISYFIVDTSNVLVNYIGNFS